ncbi:MAG: hypothetical protein IAI49_10125 [Candidatus Eremiobacteraeota bacterium]|nr:hypothetical protein [Candidatus Eremiobacteraeota bacterium]
MMTRTVRYASLALAVAATFLASARSFDAPATAAAVPTPAAAASGQTPPPLSATATPAPAGTLQTFAGQILDERQGFLFFTSGDGFRLGPHPKIDDAFTGGPTSLVPATRIYARATFDGAGNVVEIALSKNKLPDDSTYDDAKVRQIGRAYRVALSPELPNPELGGGPGAGNGSGTGGFTGGNVRIVFLVEVPPKTPFGDQVYIATDKSGWSATAIRMDRIDALHYRAAIDQPSGAKLFYKYTRGSWRSAERGDNGIEGKARFLQVENLDVQTKRDTVAAWGDEDQFAPDLGGGVPTPFNPIPFNVPPPPAAKH